MLKTLKKSRDNTAKIAYLLGGISLLSMYAGISNNKYDTVDFCFIPEILHSTPRSKFCKSGETVFRTSPKFLLTKDQIKPNPAFVQGNEKFLIPYTGRTIKNFNHASNPNYLWYSFASVLMATTSYSLYSATLKRYKESFPVLFEQYKIDTLDSQLIGEQTRTVAKFKTILETDYVKEGIDREFQLLKMMEMDQQDIQEYQKEIQEQQQKRKTLDSKLYDLQLAEIDANRAKLTLDSKTSEKRVERLETHGYEPGLDNPGQSAIAGETVQGINGSESVETLQNSENVLKSQQDTLETIKRLVRSDGSTVIIGQQGSGKSSFVKEYLRQVKATYQEFDARVFSVKNDSYEGLREQDCCFRFIGDDKIERAKEFFQEIKQEYERRLNLDEHQRDNLKPFLVILDDWISSAIALDNAGVEYSQLLLDILIIGREYQIKFVAILHSLNLKAIGIKELDQSTRSCLNLVLLGNKYIKDDRQMESYKVIETALNLPQAVPDKQDREKLKEQYKKFKVISQRLMQPVIFAYLGEYYIGIVPKFNQV